MKIVIICGHPPGVSLKMRLGCYKHFLVLFTKENQHSKSVLTLKINLHVTVSHCKLVKLPMQPDSSCVVLGAEFLHGVQFWRAGNTIVFSPASPRHVQLSLTHTLLLRVGLRNSSDLCLSQPQVGSKARHTVHPYPHPLSMSQFPDFALYLTLTCPE